MARSKMPRPRDSQGRWQKGTSGNPNGRPKRYQPIYKDENPFDFARKLIAVTQNGETEWVTREAALMRKLFEQAMRGGVLAMRTLFKRIDDHNMMYSRCVNELKELEYAYTFNPEAKISPEIERHIRDLRLVVSNYATTAPFGSLRYAEHDRKALLQLKRSWERKNRTRKKKRSDGKKSNTSKGKSGAGDAA